MIPALQHPHGARAYDELLRVQHVRYGGDTWALADKAGGTGAGAAASLRGVNAGTVSATGVTFGAAGPTVSGDYARAAAFDGAAGHIYSAYAPITLAGAWTVSAWIKGAGNATGGAALSSSRTDGANTLFYCGNSTSKLYVLLRNLAGTALINGTSNAVVFDGTWHHIALRGANGSVALYVDGVLDTANFNFTPSGTFAPTITTIGANKRTSVGTYFTGSLAYVSVIPAALTASDVKTLYTVGRYGQ